MSKATERLRSVVLSKKFRAPNVSGCALHYFLCSELYPKSDFLKYLKNHHVSEDGSSFVFRQRGETFSLFDPVDRCMIYSDLKKDDR